MQGKGEKRNDSALYSRNHRISEGPESLGNGTTSTGYKKDCKDKTSRGVWAGTLGGPCRTGRPLKAHYRQGVEKRDKKTRGQEKRPKYFFFASQA